MDPTTLEIHTRRLKAYKDENGSSADGGEVQTDLFGNDDSAMIEMVKISKAAGELVKENKQKILAVKGVVKRPQVAKEMGVDINDPEAVKAAIAQLEYENQRLMSPTPEPEILHKIKVRAGLETEESQVVETDDKQDEFLKSVIAQDMLVGNVNYSLRPKEIDESVANNVNKVREKIAYIRDNNLPTDTQSIDRICDTEMKPISKLNDKWFNWYKEKFNAKSPYIYTSEAYIVDHHFNHHPNTELSRYLLLPDTIFAPHAVKDVSTKRGPSQAFIKKYDNWVLSTLKPNLDVDENGRIILFKNFLRDKKKSMPYKNKKDINVEEFSREDAIPSIVRDLDNSKSTAGTRQLVSGRLENSLQIQSDNSAQSQGKKSGNVKGGIEAKQVDASADISEPIDVAEEDYRKISEIAQKEFKAKPALLSRVVSKSRSILPRTVKFDKSKNRLAGVPSIADIRRYAERAFALPIAAKMRRDNPKFLGVYLSDLQAIRTRGGHTNDIGLLAHELGHHLETILFAGKLSEAETAAARELADYCVERFGDNAYQQNEQVSEGFAQFISDVITDMNDARARCPQAYALLERALRDNSNAAAVFDNIRQMVALNKNGSAFDRVQANIRRASDMEKTPFMEKIKGLRRLYRRKLIDSNEGIAELAKEVDKQSPGKGKKFLDMVTNYQGGHIGQSDYSIKNQQLDIDGNVVGKGLEQTMSERLRDSSDRENFSAYLYARRAGKSDKNFFSKMLDNFFYRIKHRRIIKKQMNNWWFSRKVA